ncbi:hypothetical protein J1N35_022472 [Gossypium stocksii]|uniref:Uncharacterized protein n=1 Tax=Gossypium stocksii TaxID=47602 RepID=A0A9D3VH95_9ROSI|nr:hypothetical protein J1N35_022472 [Gossypium stocksii]
MSKDLEKVVGGNQPEESAPKFKRCKVSAVRDFSPRCGSDGSSRQIAVDRSSQGLNHLVKWLLRVFLSLFDKCCLLGLFIELSMSEGSSRKVMAKVPAEIERVVSTPKFKRRRVSAVRDFPPRCGRVTASNFGLSRQITIYRSSQGKCTLD